MLPRQGGREGEGWAGNLGLVDANYYIFLKFYLINYFFNFWLRWVFLAACGLSLVVVSGGYSSLRSAGSRCTGFSSCGTRAQQLWHMGSVFVARRL